MEDEQLWERLLDEQSDLFRTTIRKNNELQARVTELERELSVWKLAFASNDKEKVALKKQVTRLERNIGSLKDDNPLMICLIDGDGNIFSNDLISQGRAGGSQAAQLITKGITDYIAETEDGKNETSLSISGRAQIWVSVYYNKSGLQEILTSLQLCTAEQFEAFVMGFNQASPLFSFTDVGNGKEAADTKIKECMRVFTRFPQTSKIFFGGGHDNGYASTLSSLNNEGLLEKIILLQGYKDIAYEVKALQLPSVEFEGVFMTEKLPYNLQYKKNNGQSPTENEEWTSRSTSSLLATPSKRKSKLRPQSDLSPPTKYNPRACNFYYLAFCKAGTACKYGHDYDLDTQDLKAMRVNAKKSPCGLVNRNQICSYGERCPLGHQCPEGPRCKFYKAGKCKFIGRSMHDVNDSEMAPQDRSDSYSVQSDETRPVTPGLMPVPSLVLDGARSNLPFDLNPVPGSSAWINQYYSHPGQTAPLEKDKFFTS